MTDRREGDNERVARLEVEMEHLLEAVSDIRKDTKDLVALANKSRGGLWAIAAMSGTAGATLSQLLDKLFIK